MLLLSCWNILFIILTIFKIIQATRWNATVCFLSVPGKSVHITLNKNNYKNVSNQSDQDCFYTNFELNSGEKPSTIKVNPNNDYKANVQDQDLQQMYAVRCQSYCQESKTLEKSVYWNIEVIRSEMNGSYWCSFNITPYGKDDIKFETNSRTANTSIFLPTEMNTRSRIKLLLTEGECWLDKIVKLKNMETSDIYSCIYVLNQNTSSHECSLTNDSMWKIELTSQSKLIGNIEEIKILFAVTGSKTNSSQSLTFKKLAYLPTFYAFTNIGNIGLLGEAEITFENSNRYFDIFKIVMTRILDGEEYGCLDIDKTNLPKYSCKLLKKKEEKIHSTETTSITKTEQEEKIHSTETIPITTTGKGEKIQSNKSYHIMKIVIGLLAVIILFLIIIIIFLYNRDKMSRNKNVSKDNASTLQVIGEDNHFSTRNTNSVAISEPSLEFATLHQDSPDLYENIDSKSDTTPAVMIECELYAHPEPRIPPQPAQPVDNSDIEQLYTQPIKYICK